MKIGARWKPFMVRSLILRAIKDFLYTMRYVVRRFRNVCNLAKHSPLMMSWLIPGARSVADERFIHLVTF